MVAAVSTGRGRHNATHLVGGDAYFERFTGFARRVSGNSVTWE